MVEMNIITLIVNMVDMDMTIELIIDMVEMNMVNLIINMEDMDMIIKLIVNILEMNVMIGLMVSIVDMKWTSNRYEGYGVNSHNGSNQSHYFDGNNSYINSKYFWGNHQNDTDKQPK